jgi:endonuclease
VEYQGRSATKTDQGDRFLLVKPDGSVLVHGPRSVKPINWQPPGARFDVALEKGVLILFARRPKPVEVIELRFDQLSLCWLGTMDGGAGLQLSGSEFDLRDLLRNRPELIEPGFQPWARERITDQGPMDLYGEDAKGRRVVVEVKRVPAGLPESTQLWRYVEAERRRRGPDVRGILVAPRISPRALQMLEEHGLEFLERKWDDSAAQAARRKSGPKQGNLSAFA